MKISSHTSPKALSPRHQTVPVDQLFQDTIEGSYAATLKDTFYTQKDQATPLAKVLSDNQDRYDMLLSKAQESGLISAEKSEELSKNFRSGRIGPRGMASTEPLLRELENEQYCLLHHPQQVADGLYRNQDYYVSPGALQLSSVARGWETRTDSEGNSIPVADVVVVGAGPGGLTTAWQTARRGGRVVCFESELAGAAFSDAGAKPVHSLRTSADGSNLVQDGHALATLDHPMSLHGHLADHRALAKAGRKAEAKLTGLPEHGVAEGSKHPEDRNSPATRGEFFEHLSKMASSLASDFDDAFLCERSPVNNVDYQDGLFTVTSSRGHKVLAKNLVLATGLTGPKGGRGRMLPLFANLSEKNPENVTLLATETDASVQSSDLAEMSGGTKNKALVVHDRLLGQQSVRQNLMELESGARVAVVGSGESAVKACLEVLHLNPGLSVDIFCKNKLEATQTQIPNENFHTAVLENTITDHKAIAKAKERAELFATPVTPRSLQEMFEFQQAGRLRILEMGSKFNQDTMNAVATDSGSIEIAVKSDSVNEKLQANHRDYQDKNLISKDRAAFHKTEYRAVVQAIGYQKQNLENHPLRHLPPEAHQKMHLNTAGLPNHPAETSLAGLSVHGRQLADKLADEIPKDRRIELTVPQDRGIDWRDVDADTVAGIIENRGLHPGFANNVKRAIRNEGSHPQALRLIFPSTDTKLRDLYRKKQITENSDPDKLKEEDKITEAELEVLDRGMLLANRMSNFEF